MILFVSYGGGHIAILHRIASYLQTKGVENQILPLTTAVPYLESRQYKDYIKLEKLCSETTLHKRFDGTPIRDIIDQAHNSAVGIPKEHTEAYHAIGFKELVDHLGSFLAARELYEAKGRFAFFPLNFAKVVLKKLNPKAVFITNVSRYEGAFGKAAQELGIPSFGIDDLFGTQIVDLPQVETLFVENELAETNFVRKGFKGNIIISGNPVFQDLYKFREDRFNSKRLLVLLQPGFRRITDNEITLVNADFYTQLWDSLEEVSFWKQFDEVVLRLHPSMTNGEAYKRHSMILEKNINIHDSIKKVSHVMGFGSTSLYEGALAGRKYLAFEFEEDYFKLPLVYNGQVSHKGNLNRFNNKFILFKQNTKINANEKIYQVLKEEVLNNGR